MVHHYQLLREAEAIANGVSDLPPQRAHLQALLALLDALKQAHEERWEVICSLVERKLPPVMRSH